MKRWCAAVGLLLLGISSSVSAGESVLGTAGKVLQVSPGPRWVAMGEASVAACDDIYSLFWNPAGLSHIRTPQISYMHNIWLQDIQDAYFTYAQRMLKGGLAASINYFNFGEFEKINVDSSGYPLPTNETFTPYTMVLAAGYGTRLMDNMDVGGSLKIINESVDTFSSMSLAMDVGMQYNNIIKGLNAGVAVQNLGVPLEGYGLPLSIRAGVAYKIPLAINKRKDRFTAVGGVQLPVPFDQPIYGNVGLEYTYLGIVAARVGYKISEINNLGSVSGLTAGLGVNLMNFSLDYALAPFGDLGTTHRISLTYGFEPSKLDKKKMRRNKRRAIKRERMNTSPAATGGVLLPPGKETAGGGRVMMPKMGKLSMRKSIYVIVDADIDSKVKTQVDKAVFKVKVAEHKKVKQWELRIADANSNVVRKYSGTGNPGKIEWDGKGNNRSELQETIFAKYILRLAFEDGAKQTLKGLVVPKSKRGKEQTPNREMLPRIYFKEGSADLSEKAIHALKIAAKKIKKSSYVKIQIEGYTDSVGENPMAFLLSQRRADTVSRYLTASYKIPLKKISVHARGSKSPIASNQTEKGRRRNRRVEITIIYRQ